MSATRKIIYVRHGERVDYVFGKREWMEKCFNEKGKYQRQDLNLPRTLPTRKNFQDFQNDVPLTRIGMFQSQLLGEALRDHNLQIKHVFSSPSLRCIQTSENILKSYSGDASTLQFAVEPGLFDPLSFISSVPVWITPDELKANGFNVQTDYNPCYSIEDMKARKEINLGDFYDRNYVVFKDLIKKTKQKGGDILIVAHAGSLDFVLRKKFNYTIPTPEDSIYLTKFNSYCSFLIIEEKDTKEEASNDNAFNNWEITNSKIPNLIHSNREKFEWRLYDTKIKETLTI